MSLLKRDLHGICKKFRDGLLGKQDSDGMCFAVCAPLQGYLDILGVRTRLVEADFGRTNHFWLEMENGEIIDPTADQFSGPLLKLPKVYIGKLPEPYRIWLLQKNPTSNQSTPNTANSLATSC